MLHNMLPRNVLSFSAKWLACPTLLELIYDSEGNKREKLAFIMDLKNIKEGE